MSIPSTKCRFFRVQRGFAWRGLAFIASFIGGVFHPSTSCASPITLTFDVHVWGNFDYATMSTNPAFAPFNTTITVSFDNDVSSILDDTNDAGIYFGQPLINSPLTATLPYRPAPGTVLQSSSVLLDNRDYGPTQQWAEFSIVQAQDANSGARAWSYDFELDSGSSLPMIPGLLQNGSGALSQELVTYQQLQTEFTFGELAQQYDPQTGTPISGTLYQANAFLVGVSEAPEPATAGLIGAGLLTLLIVSTRGQLRRPWRR